MFPSARSLVCLKQQVVYSRGAGESTCTGSEEKGRGSKGDERAGLNAGVTKENKMESSGEVKDRAGLMISEC